MIGQYLLKLHQGIDPMRSMANGDGGKDGPDAPDYTPMAQASEKAAQIGADLGREQLAENKRQYDLNYNTLKPAIDASIQQQQLAYSQGKDSYDRLVAEGRPIQDRIKAIALGGDYTDAQKAKQEEAAGQAIADARTGTNQQMQQLIRQGLRYGWSPAKLAAMGGQAATMGAQQQVAAANGARTQKQTQQMAQMGDVYNTYAGLGSQAPNFYNSGTGAAQAASGSQLGMSNQYMNGITQGNGTIMQGQGLRMQGLGSILNAQTSVYNNSQTGSGFGQLLGAGAGLVSAGAQAGWWSDIRLKENIELVGEENGFRIYEFNYKADPSKRYRGVMAQEVLELQPDAVVETADGYLAVRYDMIGVEMKEVV